MQVEYEDRVRHTYNASKRRWHFYHVGGMPAVICGGNKDYAPEYVLDEIAEEYPGQKEQIAFWMGRNAIRPGAVYKGRRFLLVCVK